jgi:phage FluMu protein gp41
MGKSTTEEVGMKELKVGDRIKIKLSGGRLVEAEIKAVVETTEGKRLQVSFGEETARIYPWQVVDKSR